jgi:hypothetical protein
VNFADPSGQEAVALPGYWSPPAGSEYAGIVIVVSLVALKALPQVEQSTMCQLDKAASLLGGLTLNPTLPIESISFGFCASKVKRGCSCTAKCTCHVIGMPDHGNTGIFVTGAGVANSCSAARTLAKQDAGLGCGVGEHA